MGLLLFFFMRRSQCWHLRIPTWRRPVTRNFNSWFNLWRVNVILFLVRSAVAPSCLTSKMQARTADEKNDHSRARTENFHQTGLKLLYMIFFFKLFQLALEKNDQVHPGSSSRAR